MNINNFILACELLAKTLQSFKTCLSASNNLYGTLALALESSITFHKKFKVTLVPCFIPDFNLLSCELNNFTFKLLY